jgi:hypothetical protein
MTLGFTLPMIISSFSKLRETMKLNSVFEVLKTKIEGVILAKEASALAEKKETLEIEKNTA